MREIVHVVAWEAFDSRGNPTVGCRVRLADGSLGRSLVPTGASTGQFEVPDVRDGGSRYAGLGTRAAVDWINTRSAPHLEGVLADAVDEELTGPSNVTLAISQASLRALATSHNLPTWQLLSQTTGDEASLPCPMVNIFSGGRHAEGSVQVQDFLAIPLAASSMAEALECVWRVRRAAADAVGAKYGTLLSRLVADEGGIAVLGHDDTEPLEILAAAIDKTGEAVGIGIDVAATQLPAAEQFLDTLSAWVGRYPIVSVEDPMGDDDWDGWRLAQERLGSIQLIGDDFFATRSERIERAASQRIANATLIKPNQVGTLSKAYSAIKTARAHGYRTVVSARSGDTEDDLIADLSVGWGAGQIKIGSLSRSERLAKYNRLLELEATCAIPYRPWEPVQAN